MSSQKDDIDLKELLASVDDHFKPIYEELAKVDAAIAADPNIGNMSPLDGVEFRNTSTKEAFRKFLNQVIHVCQHAEGEDEKYMPWDKREQLIDFCNKARHRLDQVSEDLPDYLYFVKPQCLLSKYCYIYYEEYAKAFVACYCNGLNSPFAPSMNPEDDVQSVVCAMLGHYPSESQLNIFKDQGLFARLLQGEREGYYASPTLAMLECAVMGLVDKGFLPSACLQGKETSNGGRTTIGGWFLVDFLPSPGPANGHGNHVSGEGLRKYLVNLSSTMVCRIMNDSLFPRLQQAIPWGDTPNRWTKDHLEAKMNEMRVDVVYRFPHPSSSSYGYTPSLDTQLRIMRKLGSLSLMAISTDRSEMENDFYKQVEANQKGVLQLYVDAANTAVNAVATASRHANRTADEKKAIGASISASLANRTDEQKAKTKETRATTMENRTDEQKAEAFENRSETQWKRFANESQDAKKARVDAASATLANRTEDEKEATKQNRATTLENRTDEQKADAVNNMRKAQLVRFENETADEKEARSNAISEAMSTTLESRTDEQKEATRQKRATTMENRTDEQKAEAFNNMSKAQLKRFENEKERSEAQLKRFENETADEKEARSKAISEAVSTTLENRTDEQKEATKQKCATTRATNLAKRTEEQKAEDKNKRAIAVSDGHHRKRLADMDVEKITHVCIKCNLPFIYKEDVRLKTHSWRAEQHYRQEYFWTVNEWKKQATPEMKNNMKALLEYLGVAKEGKFSSLYKLE